MSEKHSWADQWFKAQQQFVDAWTDMAKSGSVDKSSQADLWSRGFDMWRQALGGQGQPDAELAMRKCMDMGREYFAMAEQVGKGLADGGKPKRYRIYIRNEETVNVPAGEFDTVRIEQEADNTRRKTILWAAPDLHYLPVKIMREESNGALYYSVLESVTLPGYER